jgi:predicted DNA-binding transcriptional regulator AlpA
VYEFAKAEEFANKHIRGVYISMELNGNLLESSRFQPNRKEALCPRRGLNRQEAALYVGVSPSLFDELVKSSEMPKPLRIKRRTVWDRHQLDECFDALSVPEENPWDELG